MLSGLFSPSYLKWQQNFMPKITSPGRRATASAAVVRTPDFIEGQEEEK